MKQNEKNVLFISLVKNCVKCTKMIHWCFSCCSPPAPLPADLATLLVQVERPDDAADESRTVGRFRKHLESQDREAVLDFAIACNVLRLKEADIKALMMKDPSNERYLVPAECVVYRVW